MTWFGRERVDIGAQMLDRQILSHEGNPVGKVDDVELTVHDDGRIEVTGIISGRSALQNRLGPRWGLLLSPARVVTRDFVDSTRIPLRDIDDFDTAIHLKAAAVDKEGSTLEQRLRRLVRRIPGAGHAG